MSDFIQVCQDATALTRSDIEHENIIIGMTVDAFRAARRTGWPIVASSPRPPLPFHADGMEYMHGGMILSMLGNIPFPDASSISIDPDAKVITARGAASMMGTLRFKNAYVFNADEIVHILPSSAIIPPDEIYDDLVYDYFVVGKGQGKIQAMEQRTICDEENDVAHIVKIYDRYDLWYRKDVSKWRDVCAISILPKEKHESGEFDVSPQLIAFKVKDMIGIDEVKLSWQGRQVFNINETGAANHGPFHIKPPIESLPRNDDFMLSYEKLAALLGTNDIYGTAYCDEYGPLGGQSRWSKANIERLVRCLRKMYGYSGTWKARKRMNEKIQALLAMIGGENGTD